MLRVPVEGFFAVVDSVALLLFPDLSNHVSTSEPIALMVDASAASNQTAAVRSGDVHGGPTVTTMLRLVNAAAPVSVPMILIG